MKRRRKQVEVLLFSNYVYGRTENSQLGLVLQTQGGYC